MLRDFVRVVGQAGLCVQEDYVFRGSSLLGAREYGCDPEFPLPPQDFHYTLDHLGTPRLVTTSTGTVVEERKYFPFGEEAKPASPEGPRLRFTGHERDVFDAEGPQDDLDYMHARFYQPLTGRFLAVDPIDGSSAVPQSWNRYTYVQANPLRFTDPTGELTAAQIAEDAQEALALFKQNIGQATSDGTLVGIYVTTQVGNAIDVAASTLDLLKAGSAVGSAIGADADGLQTGLAVGQDLLRTAGLLAPLAGAGRTLAAGITSRAAPLIDVGIYEFEAATGRTYVGQSGNISNRLASHIRSGRLIEGTPVRRTQVLGGRVAREIAEQRRIDQLGGIRNLQNIRNPIGPARRHLLAQ